MRKTIGCESEFEGAVATHGEACYEGLFSLAGHIGEETFHNLR